MNGIISIDPGASGGLALIIEKPTYKLSRASKCPKTTEEMFAIYNNFYNTSNFVNKFKPQVVIEKVWAFPTDARSNAFNFGMNYGKWLGIISSSGIEPILVIPKKWQEIYQPLSKEKKIRKKELKAIAQDMFPDIKVTLYNSDALLIAAWAKTMGENNGS